MGRLRRAGLSLVIIAVMMVVGYVAFTYVAPAIFTIDGDDVVDVTEGITDFIDETNPLSDTRDGTQEGKDGTSSSSTVGIPSTYDGMQRSGIVTKIVDGDTLDIDHVRIRVVLVDTPERGDAGYTEATQFTASKCPEGSYAIYEADRNQSEGTHGRVIAKVWCFGDPPVAPEASLNEQLLDSGHAKPYHRFCSVSEFGSDDWAERHGC